MKKQNKSHSIPKDQQIERTLYNEERMVYDYLEMVALNTITKNTGTKTKKELGFHGQMEGRAVERFVHRLFRSFFKIHGKIHIRLPKFNRLQDRTGHPFTKREKQCIGIAINAKRDISMISRLTGRNEKVIQKIIDKKNRKPLF